MANQTTLQFMVRVRRNGPGSAWVKLAAFAFRDDQQRFYNHTRKAHKSWVLETYELGEAVRWGLDPRGKGGRS